MTPFFVAEISGNHLGDFSRAMALVDAAAGAGASAVKLQTFEPSQMCEPDVVIESGPWAGRKLLDLYVECHTPKQWHEKLFARAKELGMIGFASAFHVDDVDFLESIGCEMLKISSFEILDLPLIRHAAATKKPLIISCGMASKDEIHLALDAVMDVDPRFAFSPEAEARLQRGEWNRGGVRPAYDVTLLKCVSSYPAPAEDCNLSMITEMDRAFSLPVGLSDHTLGLGVAVAAVTLGAVMVEKHLTLSRSDGGPDASFSSEPAEFRQMVLACREAAAALGEVRYGPTPSEMSSLPLRRKPGGKRGG